jgi:hypothetical protein
VVFLRLFLGFKSLLKKLLDFCWILEIAILNSSTMDSIKLLQVLCIPITFIPIINDTTTDVQEKIKESITTFSKKSKNELYDVSYHGFKADFNYQPIGYSNQ